MTVVASDGDNTTTQALTITITNLDEAGSLSLSAKQPQEGTALTATLSDPDIVSTQTWVWERSANRSTWTVIEGETASSYTPASEDVGNYLRVEVTYTDGQSSDEKTLRQMPANPVRNTQGNTPPQFLDSSLTRSIPENTAAGRNIGDPVTATDADETDGDQLTYTLDTDGERVFAIHARSGQLQTKAALDHETTSSYSVTVTATDPLGDSGDIAVTISVEDVDEPPTLTGPSTVPYKENDSERVATYTATDPEEAAITWALAGTDRNAFTISGGALTFNDPPDYEADSRYSVTVEATAGSHTARQALTVTITDVNEPPTITRPADTAIMYEENGTGAVATYRATDPERDPLQWTPAGADADAFTLTNGILRFLSPPDHEAGDRYAVIVQASDGELTDALPVTVTVTDKDEEGELTLSSVQPQVGTALTAILTDPDGLVSTDWVWEQSRDRRAWGPVKGTPTTSYTPETDDLGTFLRITATYTDETGPDKRAQVITPHAVRTAPVANVPPAFAAPTVTRTVGVNAGAGSRVGAPVAAVDPGDPLTYTLDKTDADAACFDIDWISGQIAVGPQGLSPCTEPVTRAPGQRTISTRTDPTTDYQVTVIATDPSLASADIPVYITAPSSPPRPPGPGPGSGPGGGDSGGGGGRGGPDCAEDLHGNAATQATDIVLDTVTAGALCPAVDVDYFTVTVPGRGLLFVDTSGGVPLRGTIWQNDVPLASGPTRGSQQAARLGAPVQAGSVVVAIQGQGGATGAYNLGVTFVRGALENPEPGSFQSGISLLSGWVCDADTVELEIDGINATHRLEAAYGTDRADTEAVCGDGDTDNGFGLLFNWNLLLLDTDPPRDADVFTVRALADGVEFGQATFTVTTLGEEFLQGVTGETLITDFPSPGEAVRLVWQQANQNFVLAPMDGTPTESPPAAEEIPEDAPVGALENPEPASFQSGIGLLSGWVCDADIVELEIDGINATHRLEAAYGTERADTEAVCGDGDTDNGFGLLFNWNLLLPRSDPPRDADVFTVRALADGVEFGQATFTVTTLGEEFLQGVSGETVVPDFPHPDDEALLVWQQANQNFVLAPVDNAPTQTGQ